MEFKVGQKYRIVDIDAWWNEDRYDDLEDGLVDGEFKNGDIVVVIEDDDYEMCFALYPDKRYTSMYIETLVKHRASKWHDGCIELITDDEQQSDSTISLYHIADVLEDSLNEYDIIEDNLEGLFTKIQGCIKSLRKAGY